jgi:hypothetical protein
MHKLPSSKLISKSLPFKEDISEFDDLLSLLKFLFIYFLFLDIFDLFDLKSSSSEDEFYY